MEITGIVAPLLVLGAGFHSELTVIGNVYLNGALLGYLRKEFEDLLHWIGEFSEMGDFLQAPVRDVSMVFPPDEYAAEIERNGFAIVPWSLERRAASLWAELASVSRLVRIYRQEKPDLVHHFTIKPISYGSIAARLVGVPYVINSVSGKGYVFLGGSQGALALQPVIKLLYRIGYHHPHISTTFENSSDKQFFIESGMVPDKNCFLVNGVGVDTEYFNYAPEQASAVPIILFPGRLLWSKGVGTLIEAARSLKARLPVRIVLVGKPDPGNPETIPVEVIEKWVREGVVEWWGWQNDMSAIYRQCHIVALPSMGEGLSKALLEAASCGRPIVTTDVPGCREIVVPRLTGFLVPTNQPEALIEKLEFLVRNPEVRQRMGQAGRLYVEENFSEGIINNEFMKIYDAILGGSI